jgi:hypothetical protein
MVRHLFKVASLVVKDEDLDLLLYFLLHLSSSSLSFNPTLFIFRSNTNEEKE